MLTTSDEVQWDGVSKLMIEVPLSGEEANPENSGRLRATRYSEGPIVSPMCGCVVW